ncbi:hypothetical protein IFM47457_03730 [Aspergillus lentulus]|nr:hypothetical protein IFM47457_03730 [Aspergillus lentulus]
MVFVDAECPENMFPKYQISRWPEAKMMSKTVVVPVAGQSEAGISSMDGDDAPLRSGAQGGSASNNFTRTQKFQYIDLNQR